MCPFRTLLDAPDQLLAAHDRLRMSGFPVVTLVNAPSQLDARTWLGQWAQSHGRKIVNAPEPNVSAALSAFRARLPNGDLAVALGAGRPPILRIPGAFKEALPVAAALSKMHPSLAVAVASGIGDMVDSLLDPRTPQELVGVALQGLIPVDDEDRRVMQRVAEARQVQPFLRGACEGILYYMLEARQETRGRFSANARLASTSGARSHEVDLLCVTARLVVEVDGPEHDTQHRRHMDAEKQGDLERQGYQVQRFTNESVVQDPVGVWRKIAATLSRTAPGEIR